MPNPRQIEQGAVVAEELVMGTTVGREAVHAAAKFGAEALESMISQGAKSGAKTVAESALTDGASGGFNILKHNVADGVQPGALSGAFRNVFDHSGQILPKGESGFVQMFQRDGALVAKFHGGPFEGAQGIWKPGDPTMEIKTASGFSTRIDRFQAGAKRMYLDNQGGVHVNRLEALHPTEH